MPAEHVSGDPGPTDAARQRQQVSIDIFDTDRDDILTAHWGATTPLARRSRCGHSQIDGPTIPTDPHLTEVNKHLVAAFTRQCLIAADHTAIGTYLCPDTFVQHDPDIAAGVAGLRAYLAQPTARHCIRTDVIAGSGSMVAAAGLYTDTRQVYAGCDLYRVSDGPIVEHWNTYQPAAAADPQTEHLPDVEPGR